MEEELLVVQVETAVKNEQFADVEAVNFVKVEVNKEFDGNLLIDAEKTSVNPTAEVLKNEKQGGRGWVRSGGDIWSNVSFVENRRFKSDESY